MPITPIKPGPGGAPPPFGDTSISQLGIAGSLSTNFAAPVGFNPSYDPSQLVINGSKVSADVTEALSALTLERTITGASTLTLVFDDPMMKIVNSEIAVVSYPSAPVLEAGTTTVEPGTGGTSGTTTTSSTKPPGLSPRIILPSGVDSGVYQTRITAAKYIPTTATLTDGTTDLTFALVSVQKSGYTLTLTFEDIIVNQLRYAYGPSVVDLRQGMTRAKYMALVIERAIQRLRGDVTIPDLIYVPDDFPGIEEAAAGSLVWGNSESPYQDAWSFLVSAANTAQWRCFSTGTAIVFGPDAWLLSGPVAAKLEQYQHGVTNIDFEWDIGQFQSDATVTMATGDELNFTPGAVVYVDQLGVCNGWWLVSDMTRELHLPDCTLTLAQPQPALTELEIAASTSGGTTTSNPQPGGNSTAGESNIAQKAVTYALAQQGKPYQIGGVGPESFDCSGLMDAAYTAAGMTNFPRTSEDQFNAGFNSVSLSNLIPGDLVFYDDGVFANPGHVVMYIGAGKCVQAMETGTNVMTTPLPGGSVGARRPAPGTSATTTTTGNPSICWNYFIDQGLTPAQTAGILGNIYEQDTAFNPGIIQGGQTAPPGYTMVNGVGFGLVQWTFTARQAGLAFLASSMGQSISNLTVQLDYIWQELTTTFTTTLAALEAITGHDTEDIISCADIIFSGYEGGGAGGSGISEQAALRYYAEFAN